MVKQWFGSFGQGLEERKNKQLANDPPKLSKKGVLVILLLCCGVASASEPSKEASYLDLPAYDIERVLQPSKGAEKAEAPSAPEVGDALQWRISNLSKPGLSIELPESAEKDPQGFGWKLFLQPDSTFVAIPLKVGTLTLPSLPIRDPSGKRVGRTNPVSVEVQSAISPKDPNPKVPVGDIAPLGLEFPTGFMVAMGVVGVLILAALVYGLGRWIRALLARRPKKPEVIRPEDEVALEKLKELEAKRYLEQREFKKFYFGISDILKGYIGARYRFEAIDSTTGEMISVLKAKGLNRELLLDPLIHLFECLDLVKFTDYVPTATEGVELVELSRKWIAKSKRPPTVLPQGGVAETGAVHHAT